MGSKVSIYSKMALSAKNAYTPLSFGSQLLPARYAQTPLTSTKNRHPLTSPKAPPNRLLVRVNTVFLPCFFLSIAESSQQIKAIIMNDNKNNAIFTSRQATGSTNCCITKSAAVLALPFFSAAKSKSPCNAWVDRAKTYAVKLSITTGQAAAIGINLLAKAVDEEYGETRDALLDADPEQWSRINGLEPGRVTGIRPVA